MPVTKTMRECYEIRDGKRGGEWAYITMHCWDNPAPDGSARNMYYCGQITIQSSFGTWGHTWTACGVPFKQFLIDVDFGYAFTKFMGTDLVRFDGEATMKQILTDIVERRRRDSLTKDEAREAWDMVQTESGRITESANDYGYAMMDIAAQLDRRHDMREYFSDPSGWPRCTRYDYQAQGFWRTLWPLFIDALKDETQPALLAA